MSVQRRPALLCVVVLLAVLGLSSLTCAQAAATAVRRAKLPATAVTAEDVAKFWSADHDSRKQKAMGLIRKASRLMNQYALCCKTVRCTCSRLPLIICI
jgi:hypothetical protein